MFPGHRRAAISFTFDDGSQSHIDVALLMSAAVAPELHSAMGSPLDVDITATLRGLADFAPKPWPARLKELQSRDGRIEISKARLQQGDVIASSSGTLGLTARGNLDGQLEIASQHGTP